MPDALRVPTRREFYAFVSKAHSSSERVFICPGLDEPVTVADLDAYLDLDSAASTHARKLREKMYIAAGQKAAQAARR